MIQSGNGRPRDRPLTARSVIASTLLGVRSQWLDTSTLVRSGELFGIGEGTTRVALSRMRASGEIEPDGPGYRLAGHLVARQARQDVSRRGTTARWDGSWVLHVVGGEARSASERSELRRAMSAGRRAELREGVWLRPDNLGRGTWAGGEAEVVARQCRTFATRPDHPAAMAEELWDLDGWAARGRTLLASVERGAEQLARHGVDALADTFVLSADVLRHLLADPLLPGALLPTGWPGRPLRRSYEEFDTAFTTAWTDWYRSGPAVRSPRVSPAVTGEAD